MNARITLTPGDGIGPEVVSAAVTALKAIEKRFGHTFQFSEHPIGGNAIESHGSPLPQSTLDACLSSDAVLLGAVGDPKWDDPKLKLKTNLRPEQGILSLRKALGVYANLRPVRPFKELFGVSPLRAEILEGVDLLVVRELTGGIYFGQPKTRDAHDGHTRAVDTLVYYDYEIVRIIELAFQLALTRKKKVTSVDKANVLESSRLWREVATQVSKKYPQVTLEHMLVDTAAMRIVTHPGKFDVIVTENMFGDILTDEAAVLSGSIGMLPSASLGSTGPGLYEPIHGSAPDIAGKGIANPYGTFLCAAMLLRHSLKLETEASCLEQAVSEAVKAGIWTPDLAGNASTQQVTAYVVEQIVKK